MPLFVLLLKFVKASAAFRVFVIGAAAVCAVPFPTWAQENQEQSQEPVYPGIPPQSKVETTIGSQQVRFYGTVLLNVSASDSVDVGQDVVLWALPGANLVSFPDGTTERAGHLHDLIFTARQTVLGLQVKPQAPSANTWQASGTVEFDFFGGRPFDALQPQGRVLNEPRLRIGYLQLQKGNWKIVAGQDRAIISPLDPVSLSHVAIPLGATAGNLWGWLPQVRAEMTHNIGDASTLLQFGVLRPQFADARLEALPTTGSAVDGTSSGLGERTTQPFYQARFATSFPLVGSRATLGAGGHYGRERIGVNREIDSWAFTFDFSVPVQSSIRVRGEGFVGSNLIPFQGGVLQGVAAFGGQFNKINAGGGWGEVVVRATSDNKNFFYVGAGTDDPRDRNLLPGSARSKNTLAWASYFHKVTDNVTVALEWSNWQFRTRNFVGILPSTNAPAGRGNVFNLALAYQF
jgi:hypothetical protein